MSTFDDLTIGDVETITREVLGGKSFSDPTVDPLMLSGGVMWMAARKDNPQLTWDEFKTSTTMGEIKSFSIQIEADALNP